MKLSALDRLFLLAAALLAAYQVVQGVEGLGTLAVTAYTVGFGILVIASLLLIILGFEILDSPLVVIASTIIPVGLSVGLISEFVRAVLLPYLIFITVGYAGVILTRFILPGKPAVFVLSMTHGVSGMIIFGLPFWLVLNGQASVGFAWVGVGGMLIGIGGLLLSFLKAGKPLLSRERILKLFPALLFLTTAAFVAGFTFI
jgi:hypothetical protein